MPAFFQSMTKLAVSITSVVISPLGAPALISEFFLLQRNLGNEKIRNAQAN